MTHRPAAYPPVPPHRNLADLRSAELTHRVGPDSVAVLPVGAIEHHGPHLPLRTDAVLAEDTAQAVAADDPHATDLWLLPTLAYGRSVEHAWAPGTMTLSTATFHAVLDDIGRCVAATGIRRLVLVNGHGGNVSAVQTALRDLRHAYGLLTFAVNAFPPARLTDRFADTEHGLGIHGGAAETSVLLHLRPELVDLSAAEPRVPRALQDNRHVRFGGSVAFGWLSDDFGPDGYIGDPTRADATAGAEAFTRMTATLADQLAEIARFEFPAP